MNVSKLRPAYEIIESDPDTVKLYMNLIPPKELKGKTEKEKLDLAKEVMKMYRIGPRNYGGKKKEKQKK